METDTNSCRSEIVPVSCKYLLTKRNVLNLCVNVFSAKVVIGDTILTSLTGLQFYAVIRTSQRSSRFGSRPVPIVLGNFWATFGVWSNFLQFWQPRANFAFLSNFWAKYRFGAQIKNEKVNDFIENFNSCEFLECLSNFLNIFFLT